MSLPVPDHHQRRIEALVRAAKVEIIPLGSANEKLALIPPGATLSVTSSAKLGLDRTLDFSTLAADAGYRVIPHLAARLVEDANELRSFAGRLDAAGITDLYVIGGDVADAAGPYRCAADVLEALAGFDHGITSVGVACYPEGHPIISEAALMEALLRAQPHADYMVSQLCFDPTAIVGWLDTIRASGVTLPLHLGLSAPLQMRKLVELSLRIGVGSSLRYVTKQHGLLGKVLRGSAYRPESLLTQLGDILSSDHYAIERLHVFSFNQIAEAIDWQANFPV